MRSGTVGADSIKFISIARDLAEQPIATFRKQDQHPGFPAALLATTRAVQWLGYRGEPEAWMVGGRVISFTCGLLSVGVVWLLARDLFDKRVADVAAFIFVVLPVPRGNAADSQSDTAHVFFYLLAAWLVSTSLRTGRSWRLAAAGTASGFAYWIRPEGLEVAWVALACLLCHGIWAHWGFRRLSVATASLSGPALLVVAPYCLMAGKLTSKQLTFAKEEPTPTFIGSLAEAEARSEATKTPVETQAGGLQAQPSSQPAAAPVVVKPYYRISLVARLLGRAIASYLRSICQGFKFIFLPFFLLGSLEVMRRQPDRLAAVFLGLLAAVHSCILLCVFVISGYIAHRHTIPLLGLAMPMTAAGLIYSGESFARRTKLRPALAVSGALAVSMLLVLPYTLRPFNREFLPVIEATRWVRAHAEPNTGVVCNSPYVGFYGALPTAGLGSLAPTLDAALAGAPTNAHYDYVILHVGAFDYHPEWVLQIEQNYRQIQELPDPYCLPSRPRKVLVFEAKQLQARHANRDSHS